MAHKYKPYKAKPGWGYKLLRSYLRLLHNYFYYKKVYWLDTDNIPVHEPVMLVSNHQNGLSDALGLVMSIGRPSRKLRMIARDDAFKPAFAGILRWMGILPAYRSAIMGGASPVRNRTTFEEAANELLMDGIVGIYPEAGHQDKHWLGKFSVGYLHIVFEAARRTGFEKDIYILPSCNHYSDYFAMREQMLIRYGKPVSVKPYYELYRKNPKEAQLRLNEVIKQKVSELMLNITDLDNYKAVDYLRNTYGVRYAVNQGYDPKKLPEKLLSDKELYTRLEHEKERNSTVLQKLYDETICLKNSLEELKISGVNLDVKYSSCKLVLWFFILMFLAPLFIVACVPNALVYHIPRSINRKVADSMLHSGINFAFSALLSIPVLYSAVFTVVWILFSLPIAIAYLLMMPFLGVFAWEYSHSCGLLLRAIRLRSHAKTGKLASIMSLHKQIFEQLDKLLM